MRRQPKAIAPSAAKTRHEVSDCGNGALERVVSSSENSSHLLWAACRRSKPKLVHADALIFQEKIGFVL